MKTFEIFLTSGASVRVKAEKTELRPPDVGDFTGEAVLVLLDPSGERVATFVAKAVLGVSQSSAGEETS